MKPKNDCQRGREGDTEQKMVGRKERQIVSELTVDEWKEGGKSYSDGGIWIRENEGMNEEKKMS